MANLRWAAEIALAGPPRGYEQSLLPHAGPPLSSSLLQRVPVGVVAGIAGYNAPVNSMVWKLGPGLAAGCTLVLKSSPRALYDAYAAQAGEYVSTLRAGLPRDPGTDLGPLIRDDRLAFVEGHVTRALGRGATMLGGGGRPDGLSGFGREMGDDGFREFFQVKHIKWPIR